MRVSDFVITKTPLRVSFLGGGTDFEYFYKKYGGSVISAAINRFVYGTVKRHKDHFNENFRLNLCCNLAIFFVSKITITVN